MSIEGLAPTQVRGDPDALRQLLLILLDNALKYTAAGGRITVGLEAGGDAAVLKVADTGIGIPPEHLPHIFERFYRVDPARSGGGSGLGLAIARWLAEAHGGGIQVESAPGRGSTFTVRLPRGAGERSAEPELPSATLGARRGVAIDRP
ncbi:sensor histidine kinase [Thermobaculum terrenum]|uniref:sensor histidine kinase n=1 Tax=Thermobaculum terrenum TaxID=166501 RepID=UPI00019BF726|nr:sensor histidine kinase [Thermobaculum terrenum]